MEDDATSPARPPVAAPTASASEPSAPFAASESAAPAAPAASPSSPRTLGGEPLPPPPSAAATPAPDSDPPAEAEGNWLDRVPPYLAPGLLVGIPLVVALLCLAFPHEVYDKVVWQYFWGPIKTDADGFGCQLSGGIEACPGYNVVNTAAWAVLLGLCIVAAGQMLQRFGTRMDDRLIVSATLWVVAGSVFHVLEDAKLFAVPLRYLFITPIIYLLFAALGILSFLVGQYLRAVAERTSVAVALQKLWMIVAIPVLAYLLLYLDGWEQVHHYVNPVYVTLFALVAYALAAWRFQRIGRIDPSELVGFMSVGWILVGLAYVFQFGFEPWSSYTRQPNPLPEALLAPVLAVLVAIAFRYAPRRLLAGTAIVLGAIFAPFAAYLVWNQLAETIHERTGVALMLQPSMTVGLVMELVAAVALMALGFRWLQRTWPELGPRIHAARILPMAFLLIFAQMVDAFATAIGIDIGGYQEKHVLSAKVIDVTCEMAGGNVVLQRCVSEGAWWHFGAENPTFLGFMPVKLLVSLLVIYAIDVANAEENRRQPTLMGLVKFAIIMVGIGPGIRDFVRMALGI